MIVACGLKVSHLDNVWVFSRQSVLDCTELSRKDVTSPGIQNPF